MLKQDSPLNQTVVTRRTLLKLKKVLGKSPLIYRLVDEPTLTAEVIGVCVLMFNFFDKLAHVGFAPHFIFCQ